MENLTRLLVEHPFFAGLPSGQVEILAGCASNLRCPPGTFLAREGQPASRFFLIRSGRVSVELHEPGVGAMEMESLGPGDLWGMSWLIPPFRYHNDARAIDTVMTLAFDATCLRGKMDADHDLGYAVAMRMLLPICQRLERARLQRLDLYQGAR